MNIAIQLKIAIPKIAIALVFTALSCMVILRHEMWLDELNVWLAARESHSFSQFLANTCYSGHRGVWDVLLYFITCFTANPVAMQIVSVGISILAVIIFLKYSPFSFAFTAGIVFSYFSLYEYNIISRGYNITWLLLIVYCVLFTRERRNYFLLTLVLAVLTNVHLFSLLISLPLFAIQTIIGVQDKVISRNIIICSFIYIVGLTISTLAIIPPANTPMLSGGIQNIMSVDSLSKTGSFLLKGLLPFPDTATPYFWNSNYIAIHFKAIGITLTLFLFITPYILWFDRPLVAIFFYISVLLVMVAMFMLKLFTGVHYMGYAFMLLITSLWLSLDKGFEKDSKPDMMDRLRIVVYKPAIAGVLLIQVAAAFYALYQDYKRPFSMGKEAAAYINSITSTGSEVIVMPHSSGPAIAGYTNNNQFYYPDINVSTSFWNYAPKVIESNEELIKRIKFVTDSTQTKQIVIALALDEDSLTILKSGIEKCYNGSQYTIDSYKEFNGAIVRGENYAVYYISKK